MGAGYVVSSRLGVLKANVGWIMTSQKSVSRRLVQLDGVLSPLECRLLMDRGAAVGYSKQEYGSRFAREARQRATEDDPSLSLLLWERLHHRLPRLVDVYEALVPDPPLEYPLEEHVAVGLNPRLRYYRYEPGGRFPLHVDLSYRASAQERSFLTVILYLNDDYSGGQTRFGSVAVQPVAGMALLFPHELRHEGEAVTAGTKAVLRTDVMYRVVSVGRGEAA